MLPSDAASLLPALLALLETESVTDAATRLGVGQPAMSRTLGRLRALLGDPLLVRMGRRVVRTRYADALLPRVVDAMSATERAFERPVPFDSRTARGVLTLSLGDDLAAALTGPLLVRLRAEAPGLDLRVRMLGMKSLDDVRRGVVDVVVTPDVGREGGMPDLSEFVTKRVYDRRFVTVSKKRRRFSLDEFCAAEHVLVSPGGDGRGYVDTSLAALGRERRVAITVPSFQAAVTLVSRTDLVSTLPDDVVHALGPRLSVTKCPVATPVLPMMIVWHPRLTTDARHKWLRKHLEAALRELVR